MWVRFIPLLKIQIDKIQAVPGLDMDEASVYLHALFYSLLFTMHGSLLLLCILYG